MKEFFCVCVSYGRQFVFDLMAMSADDAFDQCERMGYECYSVSENIDE